MLRPILLAFLSGLLTIPVSAQTVGDYFEKERQKQWDLSIQLPLAEEGDWESTFNVCAIYLSDGNLNFEEAYRWCSISAKKRHLIAQAYLGLMYLNGKGTEQSDVEAYKWLTLTKYTKLDAKEKALTLLEARMPEEDKAKVHIELATMQLQVRENGSKTDPHNYYQEHDSREAKLKAYQHLLKAAEFGDLSGAIFIADTLNTGLKGSKLDLKEDKFVEIVLLERDRSEAAKWYRRAIDDNDNPSVRYRYAVFLLQGNDLTEAEVREGIAQLDYLLANTGLTEGDRKGLARDKVFAHFQLGMALKAVENRDDEAVFWFLKSAKEANIDAMEQLVSMHATGRNSVISAADVYKWLHVMMLKYPGSDAPVIAKIQSELSADTIAAAEAEALAWFEENKSKFSY